MTIGQRYNSGGALIGVVIEGQVDASGSPVSAPAVNTDGSTDTAGVDGTSRASASNPFPSRSYGSASIATSQVSVGTSATQIVPAGSGRLAVTITMVGAGDVFVGATGVTVANGSLLLGTKGSSITIPTQGAVFGIGAVAQTVSVLETF